ncbi:hypothetical protein GmHk_14G041180 [Glycine max]|nr:hypothetical protein GmHk_14G041180 [Glycine max]
MGPLQRQAFRKVYGKILDLTAAEVFMEAVVSLAQYYDQPLRCFMFGDFQKVPTIEEFEKVLGCPLGGRKPYLFSGFLPSLSKIATVVGDSAKELDHMKQTRNGVVGLPRKYLESKARNMASQEKWGPFADILALLIFGVVLFPNVDGLVDLAAIDAFVAYHHSKESPVVAILADLFDTIDRRCEKNSAWIVCCLPALCVWLVSNLFQQDTIHPCPLQSYRSCAEKGRVDWDQHLAGIGGTTINWFPRWKEGKEGVLFSCGDYPNVPLIGTRGCINYNPALTIRQLGYPMRGAPTEESLSSFLVRDLGAKSLKVIQRVHKAWRSPLKKDKELRGIRNGVIGGYHGWLRVHTRGLDWLSKLKVINEENFEAPEKDEEVQALKLELGKARLAKEKFKSAATHIRKECTELQEENAANARALEQETKRARKEEYGREKFQGALWGSNSELKLRREERDQSRVHGMILKEELAACARSKRSLAQHLEATEQSMLVIIGQYKEELNQSVAHEQKLVEDFAQVYAEKEARWRVIDALHQEATMWMDRFALTLNGSQDLPRLLAKAKAMAEVCTAPEEINRLINYRQHMIDLMAHIIRNQRAPAQRTAPAAPQLVNNTAPGASYKYAQHPPPKDNFSPIPMAYSELWPSLLENHLVVAIPGKVLQPPYLKWYDLGAKCAYHNGVPGHNIDSCILFKYKVQHLISTGWLSFQEEGPNVKTNPLASHGGASVNAVEEDGPSRAKRLREVATSRRFIYQSLQAACIVSRGGDKRDECLFHLGESHDMETCPAVEELLQRFMDFGQLEVSIRGREEPQICMQSEEKKVPLTPKALVICFTRKGTGSTPMYPWTVPKPTPFPYQSNKVVPWKYTPPASSERVATEPGMGLGKDGLGNADVVDIKGNSYKYGLGYEPGMPGRRNVPSRLRADRVWPGRISQCFTSAGMVSEEEVATIEEEFPQDPPCFVQPCHPDSQVGNWRVISQSEVYTVDSIYEGRFFEDPNNDGLTIDFDRDISQTINEEEEEDVLSPELERLVAQEEREMKPHQEETELVNLGTTEEKKEVKVVSMGTNQTGKRFYQVKVKTPDTTSIKELGRLMEPLQMQAFRKTYGKILELTIAEVSIEAIASLTQYYDQPLRCFTFGDFQLVPTIEEFEEILGCPLGGRKPYLSSGCLPSLSRIATVVKDSARGLDRLKQTRNGIAGLPQKYLEDKARGMANQGDWVPFMDVLALLIFGVVLFPNVDGLVDLAAIDAFLAYHHSKESPVVAVLADLFDTFDRRCEKSSARIICCLPALCVWLVSHLFQQDTRHPCPLLSHRSCTEKRRIDWDQLLAGIGGRTISWFPRWKEGKEGVLFSCGRYPNIPLVGTRGCINYNPALAIRQLGYPMRGAPTEESMFPLLVRDFGAQNSKTIPRIHKAWETPLRKDQELRGIRNGIIGGYHEWLKVRIRGLDWLAKLKVVSEENFGAPEEDEEVQALKSELGKAKLAKEKFKLAATHVRKECAGLREENAITAKSLEQETKRARKEEYGRNKFRGALWGSNNELKLRREERDQSRAHSMVLKEELIACSRSKRSLSQRLCETETNMLAIIAKYQEELGLATAHEHRIADEYAQVYAEKEARGRVIDSLHQEATMWMDRFALTLNGSQELPRLLAKAKAMADTYSAPEEIHGLLGYCQHMIDLMAHIIRNR